MAELSRCQPGDTTTTKCHKSMTGDTGGAQAGHAVDNVAQQVLTASNVFSALLCMESAVIRNSLVL